MLDPLARLVRAMPHLDPFFDRPDQRPHRLKVRRHSPAHRSARVHRDRRPRSRAIPRPHCRSSPPPCPSSAGCARKFSRYIRLRSFAGANEYGVCVPTHPQSGQAGGRLARRKELALANASANAQAGATPATPEDRESAQSTASEPNGASAQPHTADDVCRALEQLLWR